MHVPRRGPFAEQIYSTNEHYASVLATRFMSRKINRAKRASYIPKSIGTCSAKGPDTFRKRALSECFSDELHVQECQKDEKSRIFSAKDPYMFCKRAVYIPHKSPTSRICSSKEKEPYLFCKRALRKCFSDALASHAASDMTHSIGPHMTLSISISHAHL